MHGYPPVMSGVAAAPGLNAIAAPHNPAPATTLIFKRPKTVINVGSFTHAQMVPRSRAAENRIVVPESY
jgi:hypothetical protein